MQAAIDALEKQIAGEKDSRKQRELRRAIDALKRQESATDVEARPDFRAPDFKQIANEPETGEELANAVARNNAMKGELPRTAAMPSQQEKAQPPVEAGNVHVAVDESTGRRTVTTTDEGQPSKPADVPAHSDKAAEKDKK